MNPNKMEVQSHPEARRQMNFFQEQQERVWDYTRYQEQSFTAKCWRYCSNAFSYFNLWTTQRTEHSNPDSLASRVISDLTRICADVTNPNMILLNKYLDTNESKAIFSQLKLVKWCDILSYGAMGLEYATLAGMFIAMSQGKLEPRQILQLKKVLVGAGVAKTVLRTANDCLLRPKVNNENFIASSKRTIAPRIQSLIDKLYGTTNGNRSIESSNTKALPPPQSQTNEKSETPKTQSEITETKETKDEAKQDTPKVKNKDSDSEIQVSIQGKEEKKETKDEAKQQETSDSSKNGVGPASNLTKEEIAPSNQETVYSEASPDAPPPPPPPPPPASATLTPEQIAEKKIKDAAERAKKAEEAEKIRQEQIAKLEEEFQQFKCIHEWEEVELNQLIKEKIEQKKLRQIEIKWFTGLLEFFDKNQMKLYKARKNLLKELEEKCNKSKALIENLQDTIVNFRRFKIALERNTSMEFSTIFRFGDLELKTQDEQTEFFEKIQLLLANTEKESTEIQKKLEEEKLQFVQLYPNRAELDKLSKLYTNLSVAISGKEYKNNLVSKEIEYIKSRKSKNEATVKTIEKELNRIKNRNQSNNNDSQEDKPAVKPKDQAKDIASVASNKKKEMEQKKVIDKALNDFMEKFK